MANITTANNQYQNTGRQFIDLNQLTGTGEVGRYLTDHTGILVGIEPRPGTYQIKDRRTGEIITRPNSWTAVFADGNMVSWPTYVDQATGQVRPWSRFDQRINLAACVQQQIAIHVWKDERQFFHLELAAQQTTQALTPGNAQPTPEYYEGYYEN